MSECQEDYKKGKQRKAFHGMCLAIVQSNGKAGPDSRDRFVAGA